MSASLAILSRNQRRQRFPHDRNLARDHTRTAELSNGWGHPTRIGTPPIRLEDGLAFTLGDSTGSALEPTIVTARQLPPEPLFVLMESESP